MGLPKELERKGSASLQTATHSARIGVSVLPTVAHGVLSGPMTNNGFNFTFFLFFLRDRCIDSALQCGGSDYTTMVI